LEYDFSIIYKPRKFHFVVMPYPECLISQRKMEYRLGLRFRFIIFFF
jgi:hypothetical protein